MFGKENKKSKWKIDYEDTIYKVYDGNGNLAAYFFPNYGLEEDQENAEENIEELNRLHQNVQGGNILFPMAKLNLLDKEEAIDLDYTILALEQSLQRVKVWKEWISKNYMKFMITGNALGLESNIILGEKEVRVALTPLLDELNNAGLL